VDRRRLEAWWRRIAANEKPGPLAGAAQALLVAGTLPFDAVARLRNALYDAKVLPSLKLPVPVVSFGNLTVGGTGKTPAVIWCAKYLLAKGLRPGIASRGYNPDAAAKDEPNDETALISEILPEVPQASDADRAKAAEALVKDHGCNIILLDDGFQHRRLHRTLDILLIDALVPFGYGYVMPRGLLREPVSSLKRATHIIITRSNFVSRDELVKIRQRIWQVDEGMKLGEAVHRPTDVFLSGGARQDPESLRGRKVYAFCGIATPQAFLITLSNLGAQVVGMNSFPDHHIYSDADLDAVFAEAAARGAELVLTTQKDRVKCGWREGSKPPLAELRVEFELVHGKETIESALDFAAATTAEARPS
jgi:tetraacyldisaccharide 4'-kinase